MADTLLDRLIAYVSPRAGLRRAQARAAASAVRSYDAAKRTRRTQGWVAGGTSANAEVLRDLPTLRARSRDLVRNNAHANRAVAIWTAHLVGAGLLPQCKHASPALARQAEELWQAWARQADAEGGTVEGVMALAVRAMVEGGDALIRRVPVRPSAGAVPLRLAVLEGDHLSTVADRATGPRIVGGVEVDELGRRVAYHVLQSHPGDVSTTSSAAIRVPASDATLLYLRQRPGQLRGVPWLSPVMLPLRDLDEWREAALVKAKVEACFSAAITRVDGDTAPIMPSSTDRDGNRVEALEPGMMVYLQPGEDVRPIAPSTNTSFEPFALAQLLGIATGVGLTYDQITGDLRQANYSSLRAGKIEFRRLLEQIQFQTVIPMAAEPVWRWFVEAAMTAGLLPGNDPAEYAADWIPPRNEPIDPLKDVEADIQAVRAGFVPPRAIVQGYGWPAQAVIDDQKAWAEALDAAGVASDADPRRAAGGGTAAPADLAPVAAA